MELSTLAALVAGSLATAGGITLLLSGAMTARDRGAEAAEGAVATGLGNLRFLEIHAELGPAGAVMIHEVVTPSAVASEVNLHQVTLALEVAGTKLEFRFAKEPGPGTYTAEVQRDPDGSFTPWHPVLNQGDLARLTIDLGAEGVALEGGASIRQSEVSRGLEQAADVLQVPRDLTESGLVRLK